MMPASLGVEDILPRVTVEWLLEPLLIKGVPVDQRSRLEILSIKIINGSAIIPIILDLKKH